VELMPGVKRFFPESLGSAAVCTVLPDRFDVLEKSCCRSGFIESRADTEWDEA
jgi:hypothetical protein